MRELDNSQNTILKTAHITVRRSFLFRGKRLEVRADIGAMLPLGIRDKNYKTIAEACKEYDEFNKGDTYAKAGEVMREQPVKKIDDPVMGGNK